MFCALNLIKKREKFIYPLRLTNQVILDMIADTEEINMCIVLI
jgi:hypothetical protein